MPEATSTSVSSAVANQAGSGIGLLPEVAERAVGEIAAKYNKPWPALQKPDPIVLPPWDPMGALAVAE